MKEEGNAWKLYDSQDEENSNFDEEDERTENQRYRKISESSKVKLLRA